MLCSNAFEAATSELVPLRVASSGSCGRWVGALFLASSSGFRMQPFLSANFCFTIRWRYKKRTKSRTSGAPSWLLRSRLGADSYRWHRAKWAADARCCVHALTAYYAAAQASFEQVLKARGYSQAEIGTHAGLADTALMLAVDRPWCAWISWCRHQKTGRALGCMVTLPAQLPSWATWGRSSSLRNRCKPFVT